MQFKGKLINETWESGKKLNFRLNFGLFGPRLGPKRFLWVLSLLLFISDVKHCYKLCVFKENIQTKENWKKNKKKTYFAPDLGPLGPNLGHYFFFQNQALSVTMYYGQLSSCKLSEKTNDSILFEK